MPRSRFCCASRSCSSTRSTRRPRHASSRSWPRVAPRASRLPDRRRNAAGTRMSEEFDPVELQALAERAISPPLVTHIYTADPSAHVFDGKIYIYPSHDIDAGIPFNDDGDHFGMQDYHVLRMDSPADVTAEDCGVALRVDDVPWAARQMWAPDAATKDGRYYLYFPAKRANGLFQIGVASGDHPAGPFMAEPEAI